MPFNIPQDQWTPEYAAQVMAIQQQAMEQNPNIAAMGMPNSLVPMGAPGSLVPPDMQAGEVAAYDALQGTNGPQPIPTPAPQMNVQPGGSQAPSMGNNTSIPPISRPAGGFMESIQPMLPLIASMMFGMNPNTRHMANLPMMIGQIQQQQMGQKQLAEIRSTITQLGEKGPDAVKKYLTGAVASPNLRPDVSKVVAAELKTVTDNINARKAVEKLTSRDPKEIMKALPEIMETLGDERGMALFKGLKLDSKLQAVQAGDQMYTFDPITGEYTEGPKATPKFNAATIGGTDVTEELTRMGINPPDATPEELQEATKRVKQDRLDREARSNSTALTAAGMNAAAIKAGMIEKSKQDVRPLDLGVVKEINQLRGVVGLMQDIQDTYKKEQVGKWGSTAGWIREVAGMPYKNETEFRQNVVQNINQYINTITGASSGQQEEVPRLKSAIPNLNDEPKVFEAKTENFLRIANRMLRNSVQLHKMGQGSISEEELINVPRMEKRPQKTPGGLKVIE